MLIRKIVTKTFLLIILLTAYPAGATSEWATWVPLGVIGVWGIVNAYCLDVHNKNSKEYYSRASAGFIYISNSVANYVKNSDFLMKKAVGSVLPKITKNEIEIALELLNDPGTKKYIIKAIKKQNPTNFHRSQVLYWGVPALFLIGLKLWNMNKAAE